MSCNIILHLFIEIERYFMAPIHPKMEIRHSRVAPINELYETEKKTLQINFDKHNNN
jgi:hypothetical protein